MRRVCFLVCVLAACNGDDEPLPTGEIAARVTHYDYALDVESRMARATLTLAVDTGGDCVTLPFRAQLTGTPTIDGTPVNASVADDAIRFCGIGYRTGTTIEVASEVIIPLATLGPSQVGYSITRDSQQNSFYYLVSWFGGCDRFAPCDNQPGSFATYKFTVTHPDTFKARCPGTITEVSATETVCDFDHPGGPSYSTFGVAAYPAWTITDKGTWGGVKVTLYDRPQTLIDDAIDVAYHGGFMAWMQSQFGPYPYGDELRILTAPTYWGGFEHPGNIVLDDRLARRTNPAYWNQTAHTLDHEIVHMWAGDQTTLAGTYDFVWKEAMAEYLTYVWEDMQSAANGRSTSGAWKGFSQGARYFPVPLEQPALFDYYGDVYGPGPMVLFRQLEALTSRQQVIDAIKLVLGTPRALAVDELVAALEQTTGLDLDAYVTGWIRGSGAPNWPRYAMTFTPGSGTSSLQLMVTNRALEDNFNQRCRFKVALRGASPSDVQLVDVNTFAAGDMNQTLQVPTPEFTVTSMVLDPENECLVFLASSTPRATTGARLDANALRVNPWIAQ
jgi:aminopeptidase N